MISKELQEILYKIATLISEHQHKLGKVKECQDTIKIWQEEEMAKAREAERIEGQIDKLQLAMRTVLNGEPSPIKVEPPKQPDEQIGREG